MKKQKNNPIYRKLQKHLNSMPVRFPRSFKGYDLKLLEFMFNPDEVEIALGMDYYMRTPEDIAERLKTTDIEKLKNKLQKMTKKGCILNKKDRNQYALIPFIVGMYELQLGRVTTDFFKNAYNYILEIFALDFLTTKKPQSRIVPLNHKIDNENKVANYDEFRKILEKSKDKIAVLNCICRTAADHFGEPCKYTDERELCIALYDYYDTAMEQGIGRKISLEEALELTERNQKAGFVMQCSNDQSPNFFCACCSDCCGLLGMLKAIPKPAEYIASNYTASVSTEDCVGCTICEKKCPMDAIKIENKKAVIIENRCIGCGVCTAACPKEALELIKRKTENIPAETIEDLYEEFAKSKFNLGKKIKFLFRFSIQGIKNKLF